MAVRDSIFGSKSEARGFHLIEHTWGDRYRLCAQFPWSALFEPASNRRDTSNLFFKTSVDYVLCTREGRPLLAIDFDGWGGGFDRAGEYVQVEATPDRNRKAKFDFKLRYAKTNDFPYHIIASEEFRALDDGLELTVVDGIIGSVIAKKSFLERAPAFLEEHADEIEHIPCADQSDYIQDLATSLEVDCDVEHNPIIHKTFEVMDRVREIAGSMPSCSGYRTFEEPALPTFEWPPWEHLEAFQRRAEALHRVEWWGCIAILEDTPVGEVSEVVKVRNVAHSMTLVNEIGELMVWRKLLRLLQRRL